MMRGREKMSKTINVKKKVRREKKSHTVQKTFAKSVHLKT